MNSNFNPKSFVVLLGNTAIFLGCAAISFCSVAAAEDRQAAVPAQQTAATAQAAPKAQWVGKVSGGIQFESGRTSNGGVTISGDIAHKVHTKGTIAFDGSVTYATYKIGGLPRTTATNNSWFNAQYLHRLNNRFFAVDRLMFQRDIITGVSHREWNATGIGVNLFLSPKGEFYVVPAFAFGRQNTRVPGINGWAAGFAGYEKLTYKLNEMWTFNQYMMVRINGENRHDMTLKGYAGLDAPALHKRLYLSIGLDYNYEGVLNPTIPGITRNDAVFGVKFNYRIGN